MEKTLKLSGEMTMNDLPAMGTGSMFLVNSNCFIGDVIKVVQDIPKEFKNIPTL